MSVIQIFTIGYLAGAAVLVMAFVIIAVRLFVGETQIDPSLPLLGGLVLMFGSKLGGVALRRRAGRN